MLLFIDFCTCAWWIPWLLSGLLGVLLGWLIWGRLKSRITELEQNNVALTKSVTRLENELHECRAGSASMESEIALLKGRVREYENAPSGAVSEQLGVVGNEDIRGPVIIEEIQPPVSYEEVSDDSDADSTDSDTDTVNGSDELLTPSEPLPLAEVADDPPIVSTDPVEAISSEQLATSKKKNIYAGLKEDNLQVIEGIGPKMNEILVEHGIKTWSDLAAKTSADIRAILDSVNAKRYRIIDPSSWPDQAKLASEGNWDQMIILQKNLDSGRAAGATGETDSKVEKLLIKMGVLKRWKKDDLTAVEGIGPKISALLVDAGINTWRSLANTEVSTIQSLLDAAGKRYKLADPSSWPKQAEMAADGRWDDLEEYQDFLQGGK